MYKLSEVTGKITLRLYMIVKPLNIILPLLILCYGVTKWNRMDQFKSILPLLFTGITSFFIFGFDYPLRFLEYGFSTQPYDYIEITIWKFADQAGIPYIPFIIMAVASVMMLGIYVYQSGVSLVTLNLAILTNFVFTIYANGNNYVMLIPSFILVGYYYKRLALIAYMLTWTPLLRLVYGYSISWIDILYAVLLLLTTVAIAYHRVGHHENKPGSTIEGQSL